MGGWIFMEACSLFCIALGSSVSLGFPLSSRCQNLFITLATLPILLLVSHWIIRPFLLLIRHPYQPLYQPSLTFAFGSGCLPESCRCLYNHFEEITNHACYLGISSLRMVGKTLLLMGPKLMPGTANYLCVCTSHSLAAPCSLTRVKRSPSVCLMSTYCFLKRQMACFWIVTKGAGVLFCLLWIDDMQILLYPPLSFIFEDVQRKKKKEKWVNLMRTDVLLRPRHTEFRSIKVWFLSCRSESSGILRIQDELVMYWLVGSEWLNRQSHCRDTWGGLMVQCECSERDACFFQTL